MVRLSGMTLTAMFLAILAGGPAKATTEFRDMVYVVGIINEALETERTGTDVPWFNPETGNGGVVSVTRTFFLDPERPCRDYRRTTDLPAGGPIVVTGTGCRTPDGYWSLDEGGSPEPEPLPDLFASDEDLADEPRTPPGESEGEVRPAVAEPAAPAETATPKPPVRKVAVSEPEPAPAPQVPKAKPVPVIPNTSIPTRSD